MKARQEYEQRVNRVIDYIGAHLADELPLQHLAAVAAFSPFHFHRVFKSITGETLADFIQRRRLEAAAQVLLFDRQRSVLATALDHGFSSGATFARAFKAHFAMSASEWRAGGFERWNRRAAERKPGKALRKIGKARVADTRDAARMGSKPATMRIKELPAYRIAYMRHVGPYGAYGIPDLWRRFHRWLRAHDLTGAVALGISHDNPYIVPPHKCRYDACVVVPDDFPPDRQVNIALVPGGKCAVRDFAGTSEGIDAAWEAVFRSWLPDSGYQPDDRPCIEVYRPSTSAEIEAGIFHCELCLPVRPL